MQRGLGGFPHERLHQDNVLILRRCSEIIKAVDIIAMQRGLGGNPHERLHQDMEGSNVVGERFISLVIIISFAYFIATK